MALKPPPIRSGEPSDPIPSDTYLAVCYGVVDEGNQDATDFNGQPEVQHQVRLLFELPDLRMGDGRPRGTSRKYKLSMHEKAGLRKAVHALAGRQLSDAEAVQFDLTSLVGKGCFMEIEEQPRKDGNGTYSKIVGLAKLPKGTSVNRPENAPVIYEIEQGEPPDTLPQWLRDEIDKSYERRDLPKSGPPASQAPLPRPTAARPPVDPDDPDVPF